MLAVATMSVPFIIVCVNIDYPWSVDRQATKDILLSYRGSRYVEPAKYKTRSEKHERCSCRWNVAAAVYEFVKTFVFWPSKIDILCLPLTNENKLLLLQLLPPLLLILLLRLYDLFFEVSEGTHAHARVLFNTYQLIRLASWDWLIPPPKPAPSTLGVPPLVGCVPLWRGMELK